MNKIGKRLFRKPSKQTENVVKSQPLESLLKPSEGFLKIVYIGRLHISQIGYIYIYTCGRDFEDFCLFAWIFDDGRIPLYFSVFRDISEKSYINNHFSGPF